VLARKLMTSGTILFENDSYCNINEQRKRPDATSFNCRMRLWARYWPIKSCAGAATGLEKSDVDHTSPTSLRSASSGPRGNVLESDRAAPLARPLVRFFCMRCSLDVKCPAAVIGLRLTSAMICGTSKEMALNESDVDAK